MIDARETLTENGLKQAVLKVAYAQGWLVYHVPQATMRNGGGKGYPDLTLARDGVVLWLELKAKGGTVTVEQWRWISALQPYAHVITPDEWWSGRVHELLA